MKINMVRLPKAERYPCRPRDIKAAFMGVDLTSVTFSHQHSKPLIRALLSKDFAHDTLLASLSFLKFSDHLSLYIGIYSIRRDEYSDQASTEFAAQILPAMRAWCDTQLNSPSTAFIDKAKYQVGWREGKHIVKHVNA